MLFVILMIFDAIRSRVEFIEGANAEARGGPELVLSEGLGDGDGGVVDRRRWRRQRRNGVVLGAER